MATLQKTGYRIPRWYTEGLAVWSEGHPRPLAWNGLQIYQWNGDEQRFLPGLPRQTGMTCPPGRCWFSNPSREGSMRRKWANHALEIDVNDAEVHMAFAEALLARHNREMALRELEAAVLLDPGRADYQLALAETLLFLGRVSEARAIVEPIAEAAPHLPRVHQLLELLKLREADDKP